MNGIHRPTADWSHFEKDRAEVLVEPYRSRLLNALHDHQRILFAPQSVYALAKLGCLHCGDETGADEGGLMVQLLCLNSIIGADEVDEADLVIDRTPGPFGRDLIANQIFNATRHPLGVMGRFERRWLQLPLELAADPRMEPLAERFEEATGIALDDLMAVGLTMWLAANRSQFVFDLDYFAQFGWQRPRLQAVLDLISADPVTFRETVAQDVEEYGLLWSISPFERWPLLRRGDGQVMVLDPDLLIRRVFGWLPLFDIKNGLESMSDPPVTFGRIRSAIAHSTEMYVLETIRRTVGDGLGQRVFDDRDLDVYKQQGRKKADVVIDYGNAFVVIEITSMQPTRHTAAALSDAAVNSDIAKLVDEARQVAGTIDALREDSAKLTGHSRTGAVRFYPVLVCEAFPTNPISMRLVRGAVCDAGLLNGPDIAALEILDLEEIEMFESLQEVSGRSMPDILEAKANSTMALAGVREYVLSALQSLVQPSKTLNGWSRQVIDRVAGALEPPR